MTLIRNFCVLLTLACVTLSSACKEESTKKVESETHASVIALEEAIEKVELAEARGLALTSASPETATIFKRILTRSKAAAGLLRIDSLDLTGLTELVRSRDELRNLTVLTEDYDTIGIYRTALEKAVSELAVVQGVKAYELADPNIYHELFSQSFNLGQKLGAFTSFVEMRDAKGPKLFEPGTCGEVCGNTEYIITDVTSNQVVWLLSPRLTLPDAESMKLILKGYVRGNVHNKLNKGFRLYVSESFTGAFTGTEGQWTEITSMVDPYLPTDKASNFTSYIDLDAFRGKSLTFAIRVQGLNSTATMYQMQNFSVLGKGRASVSPFNLVSPEPFLFKEPEIIQQPGKDPEPVEVKPGELSACLVTAELIDIKASCRVDFMVENAFELLLGQTGAPFTKYNHSGQGLVVSSKGGGWKAGTGCTPKANNKDLQAGFCAQRSALNSKDMLVSPPIKLDGNFSVKIQYAVLGPTLSKMPGEKTSPRLRALVFDQTRLNMKITDMKGIEFDYGATGSMFDVQLQNYPGSYGFKETAALGQMTLDPVTLAAKIGSSGSQFRLALLQSLEGEALLNEPTQDKTTVWHLYSIDFIKTN